MLSVQSFPISTKPIDAASCCPLPGWDHSLLLPWAILSPRTIWMEGKGATSEPCWCPGKAQGVGSGPVQPEARMTPHTDSSHLGFYVLCKIRSKVSGPSVPGTQQRPVLIVLR